MVIEHALITGAGGGIGAAIARALHRAAPNARLTLVDLDLEAARSVAAEIKAPTECLDWDLRKPDALERAFLALPSSPDCVINCAGFMEVRLHAKTPWALGEALLQVDLISPLRLMSLATPTMQARGRGWVVNVSSMAGVTPLRGCTYYGAAKAGLAMASEIARLELAPHGVRVLTVYPGPVRSKLEARARAQVGASMLARLLPTGDPEVLGERIVRAMREDRSRVVFPGFYDAAYRARGVASWFTSRFGPIPRG